MQLATRSRSIAAFSSLTATRWIVPRAGYSSTSARLSNPKTDPNPANYPPQPPVQNVSASDATTTEDASAANVPLQESPDAGERARHLQAPNRPTTWASSQQPKELAMTGPRFEQTIIELQVSFLLLLLMGFG